MFYLEKTKMEKFTTRKKFNFEEAQDVFVNFGIQYIKHWTDKQLKTYITEPVVIPIGNYGFLIGPYIVTGKSKTCWSTKQQDGKFIHDFVSKTNAVLYCIRAMQNKSDAYDILELDRQLGKLDNDIVFYQNTLNCTKNQFKNEITLNRYIDAKLQRRNVLNILKKTLISAKYLKFGNTPL
jgi:hypothetical protein